MSDSGESTLDNAGALPARTERRLRLTGLGIILIVILFGCLSYSGALVPRLTAQQHGWGGSLWVGDLRYHRGPAADPKKIHTSLTLVNDGWYTLEVVSIGGDLPGLRFTHVSQHDVQQGTDGLFRPGQYRLAMPVHVPSGYPGTTVALHYEVTDCSAVPSAPQAIPVRIVRPWGEQTVNVQPPPLRPSLGGWSVTTRDDPYRIEWQRFLADDVCGTRWEAPEDTVRRGFNVWG